MAVINNLRARFTGFYVNNQASRLVNCVGSYNTSELLNGGELENNTLQYDFVLQGLQDHTIKSIIVKSLLLTSTGELASTKNMTLGIDSYGSIFRGNFETSEITKTIISTEFTQIEQQEQNEKTISVVVAMNSVGSCYYALHSIVVNLQDIDYSISISFTGPNSGRTVSTIQTSALLIKQGAVDVTFSKDPSSNFDPQNDNIEGRIYYKKDGIYIDGYQYGVNAPATGVIAGIVRLQDEFERDENQEIIAPVEGGVAASPQLVYGVLQEAIKVANTEDYGRVKLRNSFEIDPNDGGIVAPIDDEGIAASSQLVYNALLTAKNYVDETLSPIEVSIDNIDNAIAGIQATLDGIDAPLIVKIEDEEGEAESVGAELIFSNDFEKDGKKLYIKWLEIS